jgi:polyhydroxyalkanoate synthase
MNAPEKLPPIPAPGTAALTLPATPPAAPSVAPPAAAAFEQALDPYGTFLPLLRAQWAWWTHPAAFAAESVRQSAGAWSLVNHAVRRAWGLPSADPLPARRDDDRFNDPVWTEHPFWDIVKENYLFFARQSGAVLEATPGLSESDRKRAVFWWRKFVNAAAPTNAFWTNPVALHKAVQTQGLSVARGAMNFLADMAAGEVRMTPLDAFVVGRDLATTPGAVVMRNRLLEVIHYRPTQPRVHTVPVVIVTPWINKYYVLDLTPAKSMVRYLLAQGIDVYITSWKNPDAALREVRFDDYLTEGIGAIIETARRVSGAPRVHAVGYCIGGIALTLWMAWAQRHYERPQDIPVADWTLFATLVDFHAPGEIDVFLDPGSVEALERRMAGPGFLEGRDMAGAFRLLRSRSLIWQFVVHGWLYGEAPPPFDVLFWNEDSTRMGALEHGWYLRELYLNNKMIVPDRLTVAGEPIDLRRITQPLYAVACEDDHIAPWQETFRVNDHVAGERRYVLSSSGHILGIVNPVVSPPKRRYRAADVVAGETSEAWQGRSPQVAGSWWEDWMRWLTPRLGELRTAPPVATVQFPVLAEAPGTYVHER